MSRSYAYALSNPKAHSQEFLTPVDEESKVQQHMKDEVDVNTIVRRFAGGGAFPTQVNASGVYGDFTGLSDLDSALERVTSAQQRFMSLPAEVRERFGNSPIELARLATSLSEEDFAKAFAPKSEPVPPVAPAAPPATPVTEAKPGA